VWGVEQVKCFESECETRSGYCTMHVAADVRQNTKDDDEVARKTIPHQQRAVS
jgi:hypothetical protein